MGINQSKGYSKFKFFFKLTYLNLEVSKRDDLEAWLYTLIFLATGELPWIHFDTEQRSNITFLKQNIDLE